MFRATGFGAAPHQSGGHARRGICLCGGQGPTYRQMQCWPASKAAPYRSLPRGRESSLAPHFLLFPPNPLRWASAGVGTRILFARRHGGKESLKRRAVHWRGVDTQVVSRKRTCASRTRSRSTGRGEKISAATRPQAACRKGLRNGRGENRQAVPTSAATQTTQVSGERILRNLRIILISDKKL